MTNSQGTSEGLKEQYSNSLLAKLNKALTSNLMCARHGFDCILRMVLLQVQVEAGTGTAVTHERYFGVYTNF